ncbi:MAG: hypothetical protein ACRETU_03515 [Steroidobacterales bacterium]
MSLPMHSAPAQAAARLALSRGMRLPVSERRARLVVQCACELLGVDPDTASGDLQLTLSVQEFEQALRDRYAVTHPQLIYRTDSTLERARLERARLPRLPRVILRRGAPPGRRAQPEG